MKPPFNHTPAGWSLGDGRSWISHYFDARAWVSICRRAKVTAERREVDKPPVSCTVCETMLRKRDRAKQ